MAFLSPRAGSPATTTSATSDSTTFTVTLSAHQAGDYLLIFLASDNAPVITSPGWTQVKAATQSTNVKGAWFLRDTVAASASEANPTFTADAAQQFAAAAYSIPASLFNIDGVTFSGLSTSGDPPSLTPLGGVQDYLFLAGLALNGGASNVSAFPSGYTNTAFDGNGGSGGCVVAVAEKQISGSSENPGAFTNTNTQWASFTMALWGAPPGGGGGPAVRTPTMAMMGVG